MIKGTAQVKRELNNAKVGARFEVRGVEVTKFRDTDGFVKYHVGDGQKPIMDRGEAAEVILCAARLN